MDSKEFNHKDGVSLLKHFEVIIENLAKYFESRIIAVERAIVDAKESMEHRLVGMNEIRSTLTDQANTFVTKAELKPELESIKRELVDYHTFKEDGSSVPSRLVSVEKDVKELLSFKDTQKGSATQSSVMWAYVISAVSIILTVVGLLSK